ncbi:MAG: polysaccharide biosynthesis protein [Bacteroidales bacterium]|nr:polysaccharide biosynthesis protein [Bacteroidales bacterium]
MIPKTIHYCWFSGEQYPSLVQRCIKSWKRHLPCFTLRLWNRNSFDWNSVPFVSEALDAGKWAFAADYIRLYALYTEGGIYLDSDVEVLASLDEFLTNKAFMGTEPYVRDGQIYYDLECAVMGAEAHHPTLRACLDLYQSAHFDAESVQTICHQLVPIYREFGYQEENIMQHLDDGTTIYPLEHYHGRYCFYHKTAIHWAQGSWLENYVERGRLFYLCQRMGWTNAYQMIENIARKL